MKGETTMKKRIATTLSLFQLTELFPTVESAVRYFEGIRWHGTPACTKCEKTDKITAQKKVGTYWCGMCREYFTVFTNTPLERNKVDARKWLFAAYLMLTARKGISSIQLSKELAVQQRTAWYMMHRLRKARETQSVMLSGLVEIDETYVGGKAHNKHIKKGDKPKAGMVDKQAVLGMRERDGKTVARSVPGTDRLTLMTEIQKTVKPGSTIYTDDHGAYRGIERKAYQHEALNHSANEYVKGLAHTNEIESVWAVLKCGLEGTFHHVSVKHLDRYVNEFTFRLNEGNCQVDTEDRVAALFGVMSGKTMTYKGLIGKGRALI